MNNLLAKAVAVYEKYDEPVTIEDELDRLNEMMDVEGLEEIRNIVAKLVGPGYAWYVQGLAMGVVYSTYEAIRNLPLGERATKIEAAWQQALEDWSNWGLPIN